MKDCPTYAPHREAREFNRDGGDYRPPDDRRRGPGGPGGPRVYPKKKSPPGPGYVCKLCNKTGHWVFDCEQFVQKPPGSGNRIDHRNKYGSSHRDRAGAAPSGAAPSGAAPPGGAPPSSAKLGDVKREDIHEDRRGDRRFDRRDDRSRSRSPPVGPPPVLT
jgi:hypothetical protein